MKCMHIMIISVKHLGTKGLLFISYVVSATHQDMSSVQKSEDTGNMYTYF